MAVLATLAPRGLALVGADPIGALQPHVGAPAGKRDVLSCRRLRLPVERHLADGDRAPRLGAQPQQLVFDAEPRQPVGEVADRLVVVEVGLADPALGTGAGDDEAAFSVGLDA